MCARDTLVFLLGCAALMVSALLLASLLTLLTAELHLVNLHHTLHPFQSVIPEEFSKPPRPFYPFTRGKRSVMQKFSRSFERPCYSFTNCTFSSEIHIRSEDAAHQCGKTGGSVTLFFACDAKYKRCTCEEHWGMAHILEHWSLLWDFEDSTCRVSVGGPCGYQKGLKVSCAQGTECIYDRCRNPENVGKTKLYDTCDDDFDCQLDLICERPCSGGVPRHRKRCIEPYRSNHGRLNSECEELIRES